MIAIVPPPVLVGFTFCALYAGLFHVWGGRTLRDLVAFWLAAIVGFALGQAIGVLLDLPLPRIGQVYVIEASLFAWVAMIGMRELLFGQHSQEIDGL
jgi:hypothetical protein